MRRRGVRAVTIRLTAIGLGLLVGGLLGEVAIRLYASFDAQIQRALLRADPMAVSIAPHGDLGYRPRPNSVFRYGNGAVATANAMGYRGPVVAIPKPVGTFRVILLGGSTTHGWGVADDETIDAHMRVLLRQEYPHRKVDVINLAFDGYDSLQLLERLRSDAMRLEPDLIVINEGINDVRNTRFKNLRDPDPRTLIWESVLQRLRQEQAHGGPSVWTRIKHHSYVARLPVIARQYWTESPKAHEPMTPNLQAIDIFERNLQRMATLASDANVPVMFSTPPSSLASRYAPDATSPISYWVVDAATTQRLRDELAGRMRRVVADELKRGRRVAYVPHHLSPEMFLDDAHLTSTGNRQMALDFVNAMAWYLDERRTTAAAPIGVRRGPTDATPSARAR
jgi:lysophospholipase L1-like esterase